ncbi:MAG: Endonuclease-3 [Burkholderia sp.]|nr:Endonuclease-3 [Burkholderia sp.]
MPESIDAIASSKPGAVEAMQMPVGEKALEVHRRLCGHYGCPLRYFHTIDPMSELVASLLSHRTLNRDSGLAFRTLRERFADWAAVRDAPVSEVQDAIAACTWPEQKAPRLQAVLREVSEREEASAGGTLSLDFLRDWPVAKARAWLETLPGVGPKTSAAVLSFSTLRGRALPVDSHHHRVAARLGLIPENLAVGPSHKVLEAQLPADWDAQQVYDNHQVLMRHGKDTCTWRAPRCTACLVLDLCPHGQARVQPSAGTRY